MAPKAHIAYPYQLFIPFIIKVKQLQWQFRVIAPKLHFFILTQNADDYSKVLEFLYKHPFPLHLSQDQHIYQVLA